MLPLLAAFRPSTVDLVVCLPPYVASARVSVAEATSLAVNGGTGSMLADAGWVFMGGPQGTEVVESLVRDDLHRVLSPHGVALMCLGNDHDAATIGGVVERASGGKLAACVAGRKVEEGASVVTVFRIERCTD